MSRVIYRLEAQGVVVPADSPLRNPDLYGRAATVGHFAYSLPDDDPLRRDDDIWPFLCAFSDSMEAVMRHDGVLPPIDVGIVVVVMRDVKTLDVAALRRAEDKLGIRICRL